MRDVYEVPKGERTKNSGQDSTGPVRSDRKVIPIAAARITFGDLARFAWPTKTDAELSFLTGYDARTCRRWIAGDTQPPAEALSVIWVEIMKRFHQR